MTALPESYTRGSLGTFSWDSAWWVFNVVANYASLKYERMITDIRGAQQELEGRFLAMQPAVEQAAADLYRQDPELAADYLTTYSTAAGERVAARWRDLAGELFVKYNDGYVRGDDGAAEVGYPEGWLRAVVATRPERFLLRQAPADSVTNDLPY